MQRCVKYSKSAKYELTDMTKCATTCARRM